MKCIEDEIPFDVPDGWAWCRLRNLFLVGSAKRVLQSEWKSNGIPFYRAREIVKLANDGYVNNDLFISEEHYRNLKETYGVPAAGDLMVTGVGTIGKVYVVKEGDTFYYKDASVLCFGNKYSGIISAYAKLMIDSPLLQSQIHTKTYGNTVDTITITTANEYLCALPPVAEQQRIVDSINNTISLIDSLESNYQDISAMTIILKSKVLDLAIRGELVPQNPDDEPASVLLDRIRAEKEELIKSGKIKRDKKESVIFKGDDNSYYLKTGDITEPLEDWELDGLPDSWSFCCLGEICDYGNCVNVATVDIDDSAWILDLEDIEKDTGIVLQKVHKAKRNSISTKHLFHKGQVLYSKLRPYLNKVVLADEDGYCTSEILPLDFQENIIPQYARYYLMSPTFLQYTNKCSYGVKMPRLGTVDGKKAIITIPPLDEQKRIIEAIETIFAEFDEITNSIA